MSAAWQPEMDHLRRRVEELMSVLCQGHPAGVVCGVCRPEPVPECCTDGTCPTCAPMMAWADYRKDYQPWPTVTASKAFLAGWEASREYHRDTPDPEPETGEVVTLCRHGLDAADCPEHGHTLDDHCPVCFGSCGGFPVPEIECCGRGPACGACDDPEPDPEPVPEWREWVTAQHDEVVGSRASALEDVLMCLSEVERGASKNYALARIIAVCEAQVGGGWQADPSGWVATPALHALLRRVAGAPTGLGTAWPETDWQGLANAASAWLRDLTDGAE